MKLVIEIPKEEYLLIRRYQDIAPNKTHSLAMSIINGTPLPKGHWIKSNKPNEKYVCSECGGGCWYYDYQADVAKSRYCPNCGADMRDKENEE